MESEHGTPVKIKGWVRESSQTVPEFDTRHLMKAGGQNGQNVVSMATKMRKSVRTLKSIMKTPHPRNTDSYEKC